MPTFQIPNPNPGKGQPATVDSNFRRKQARMGSSSGSSQGRAGLGIMVRDWIARAAARMAKK